VDYAAVGRGQVAPRREDQTVHRSFEVVVLAGSLAALGVALLSRRRATRKER